MKCHGIASFFHFVEKLAAAHLAGPILVRCPASIASLFHSVQLQEPFLSSFQYIERQAKNDAVIFCLNNATLDIQHQALLEPHLSQIQKPLFWMIESSDPALLFEQKQCYPILVIYDERPHLSVSPLRDLIRATCTALPQRHTPDNFDYVRQWLRAFITEITHHENYEAHTPLALTSLQMIIPDLARTEQSYVLYRHLKWALFSYLCGLKKMG
jgi:hypothetical protein